MLLSMTGFGKSVVEVSNKKITVELKSLNSKQLDLSMRIAAMLREKEMEMRNTIARTLERGKVEASVYVESLGSDTSVHFNMPQLEGYKAQIEEMSAALGIPTPADWYSVLLRFPDVMKNESGNTADDEDFNAASEALAQAIEALSAHRRAEGVKLEEFFTTRIANITALLAEVPKYESERVEHIRSRIIDNLSSLPQVEYDRSRLEQEMIFYLEKLDITEEKVRLTNHLKYFRETMDSEGAGVGKKLGFITQEMGREINTLGSKSNQSEMQIIVVKMKDILEQIKEQVLNIL